MSQSIQISIEEARDLALISQGLGANGQFGAGLTGTIGAIQKLGYVQIDTINIIERAHHHTLWNRVKDYRPEMLSQLQSQPAPQIFEYWSHAAAYLPIHDFRFSLPLKKAFAEGKINYYNPDPKAMALVWSKIKNEGPLMSKDFQSEIVNPNQKWQVRPTKIALEQLVLEGKLIVSKRINFHKVYDLPSRIIPSHVDQSMPSTEEYARHLICSSIIANGLISLNQINYLRKVHRQAIQAEILKMEEEGLVQGVRVVGLGDSFLSDPKALGKSINQQRAVHLLNPFDNAIIQRRRVQDLFGFDYQLECYLPASKRKYGYFCLPILWGNQFVGRLDPKVDRKKKTFIIVNLMLEQIDEALLQPLGAKILQLADFNGCDKVVIERTSPRIKGRLRKFLIEA